MRRVATERLGIVPDQIAAGHCAALSRPRELAGMLGRLHSHARRLPHHHALKQHRHGGRVHNVAAAKQKITALVMFN